MAILLIYLVTDRCIRYCVLYQYCLVYLPQHVLTLFNLRFHFSEHKFSILKNFLYHPARAQCNLIRQLDNMLPIKLLAIWNNLFQLSRSDLGVYNNKKIHKRIIMHDINQIFNTLLLLVYYLVHLNAVKIVIPFGAKRWEQRHMFWGIVWGSKVHLICSQSRYIQWIKRD